MLKNERTKIRIKPKMALIISIIFTFICIFGANLILSDFGKVKIETITVKTRSDHNVSVRLFKPKEATSENKAPAVILAHGLSTTKECYAQYALESF